MTRRDTPATQAIVIAAGLAALCVLLVALILAGGGR